MPEKDLANLLYPEEKSARILHDAGIHSVEQPGGPREHLRIRPGTSVTGPSREALLMSVDANEDGVGEIRSCFSGNCAMAQAVASVFSLQAMRV